MMGDMRFIDSVRAGDSDRARALLDEGSDVNARDEHEWTALCWAAGAGRTALVRLLLDRGADVCATGTDGRTPYQIAEAAGRLDVLPLLATEEAARGGACEARSSGRAAERPFCRAYPLRELRRFTEWTEPNGQGADADVLSDDTVVFLQRDGSVTRTVWPHEAVLFDGVSEAWQRFCAQELQRDASGI